jgi:PIN domain nuclease of toxin-antitoxin system
MRLLLDTHVVLWWLADDARLRPPARTLIADGSNVAVVSAASAWEIAIKSQLGKVRAPDDLLDQVRHNGFDALPITFEHAHRAGALVRHHADPFDRMLVAQAQLERLSVVTADRQLAAYDIDIVAA